MWQYANSQHAVGLPGPPYEESSLGARLLEVVPGGLVVYGDLLAPDILLDDLGVLDDVFADP
jgi:hypothetical protein